MGIRLELLVILLILGTVGVATMVKLTNTTEKIKAKSKELEFRKTEFIEVDTDRMISKSFVQKGIREKGILTLKYLQYSTENITLLLADKARYHQDILLLEGNVHLKENEGFSYNTEHANYNQKSEILTIPSKFIAQKGKNIIRGESLRYDAVNKEMNATKVDALIYTTRSEK